MLNEERKIKIINIIEKRGSISVQNLCSMIDASESTIRRDLNELDRLGLITKVHGGAISKTTSIVSADTYVKERQDLHSENKMIIGKYAASLIEEGDCVYIDAGTTTSAMIDFISVRDATFITNAVSHANKLAAKGYKVFLPGGYLKPETEALIGSDTYSYLDKCNFSKAFMGTNGISLKAGYSTPDPMESSIKALAFNHCREKFILADSSKFGQVSAITFAQFDEAIIITNDDDSNIYSEKSNVIIAK